jgi:Tfp pilus assembly protein PilW
MITGFFGLLIGIVYLGVVGFVFWMMWRLVTALEQVASAQERSANSLAEIARKQGSQT